MSIPGGAPSLFFAAAAGAAADFAIDRSLRFNSADSSSLSRTPSSASNRRTWTWSGWVKKGASSAADAKPLFAVNGGSNATSFTFRFDNGTDDTLRVENNFDVGSPGARTVAVFRDFSSWMHVVLAMDTTQSNVTDGLKIYVNGVLQQLQNTVWNSNIETLVNSTNAHYLGTENTSNRYFDGYLADVQFVDGQALAPTDFGETDSNGVWQGKLYSGSYGTNGFHLKFADNSTDSALGTDSSGNSNTWTVNNLQASTGDTTPSENFTAVTYTGNGGTQSISSLSFSPDLLWIKSRNSTYDHYLQDSVRGATKTLEANQTGAETTNADGVSSFDANGFSVGAGTGYTAANVNNINYVAWAFNAGANSNKTYTVKVVSDGGNKYRFDDFGTSAVTLELAEGSTYVFDQSDSSNSGHPIRFGTSANGTDYTTGVTHTGTPGSAGAKTTLVLASGAATLYYSCLNHSGMGGQINTNSTSGASNFDGSVQAVVKANQTKGFSIVKFSGTGSSASVGHGLNSAPSFWLQKSLSTGNWNIYHSSLGANKYLQFTNSASATASGLWGAGPSSSVMNLAGGLGINNSSTSYIAYCWSEVSSFSKFGIYTGNGSTSGPTITTGFKPAFILIKRTNGDDRWTIQDISRSPSNPSTATLSPNLSNAELANAFDVDFLSNGFQIKNTNSGHNTSGSTYIYAAFADNLGGEGCDSLVDTPEQRADQSDDGVGGNVVGNYCVMNSLDMRSNVATQNGNLEIRPSTSNWGAIRGTIGVTSGKWYYEVKIESSSIFIGIATSDVEIEANAPQDSTSVMEKGTLVLCDDGRYLLDQGGTSNRVSYTTALAAGDVIGASFDLDGNTAQFYKNGTALGSISIPSSSPLKSKAVLPYIIPYENNKTVFCNFGQRPFHTAAPTGYKALNTASLPTPTIADGSQYFDCKTYTSNGQSSRKISFNFGVDFFWSKVRNFSENHSLHDSVRGADKVLRSSTTNAENTLPSGVGVLSFDSDGVTLGLGSAYNSNGTNAVIWAWNAGTSTVSNTDGSISSQVRASQTAGFSIVSFTAGSSGSLGHGLNAEPFAVIFKNRDTAGNWRFYHKDVGTSNTLFLNTTGAATSSAERVTAVSSSTFTVGGTISGDDHIALCFAPVAGYSAMGTYEGTGSDVFVYLGFRPRFILHKDADTAHSWHIFDTARDPDNPVVARLFPNSSNAENTSNNNLDILSNGFVAKDSNTTTENGKTYIYMAFAENPFSLARAR